MTLPTPALRAATVGALALLLGPAGAALADDLPAPTGETVLTVAGEITNTNGGGEAAFDMEMLKALPAASFETETIWAEGPHRFTGVPLHALLEAVGAEGQTIAATAINDYSVDVPVSDAVEGGPIVAYSMDGDGMSVREKGPLWIVYPYDAVRDYQTEVIYSRSIWQLDRITVHD